ncbi:hypothetical protein ElyMa_006086700 [Elysia marginata]|uniref:Uncharacterized protein n=1 Tax=Elysia marginata TaxID=1093978 RepID=A0AAV4GR30_9GAST|nr:hypothetical protein ElyMa_006086700 [Elysia marginata]
MGWVGRGRHNLVQSLDWPQRAEGTHEKTHKTGQADLCSWGEAAKTAEHNICTFYKTARTTSRQLRQSAAAPTDMQTKLWGTTEELEETKSVIHQTVVNT